MSKCGHETGKTKGGERWYKKAGKYETKETEIKDE